MSSRPAFLEDFSLDVTRSEIAEHIVSAFAKGSVHRDELVAAAADAGARTEVLSVLRALPDQRFKGLRDLWPELPGLPVGA